MKKSNSSEIDKDKMIAYWIKSSDEDFDTVFALYDSKKFAGAMFIDHLVIEKLLKATIVDITDKHAPLTHDLRRLALLSKIDFFR